MNRCSISTVAEKFYYNPFKYYFLDFSTRIEANFEARKQQAPGAYSEQKGYLVSQQVYTYKLQGVATNHNNRIVDLRTHI